MARSPFRVRPRLALITTLVLCLLTAACASDDAGDTVGSATTGGGTTSTSAPQPLLDVVVVAGQARGVDGHRIARLNPAHGQTAGGQLAFQLTDVESQPIGLAANESGEVSGPFGPICFVDDRTALIGDTSAEGTRRLGAYTLSGRSVDDLELDRVGDLGGPSDPTQPIAVACAVMADGRIVTAELTPDDTGQLVIWPDADVDDGAQGCPVAVGIAPVGQIAVDGDDVVATTESAVLRFAVPSAGEANACVTPGTSAGEPIIETGSNGLDELHGIVRAGGDGGWYVSSRPDGVVNEYDDSGAFVRSVLADPAVTPGNLALGPDGQLYLVDGGDDAPGTAALLRLDVTADATSTPQTVAADLDGPLSLAIYVPGVTGGRADTQG